jgi:EmrB/QacA subfamily drug resistance transporter
MSEKLKSSGKNLILFATILASGMAFLDGSVVNIAVSTIQSRLQASLSSVEWVINSYALMLAALILLTGALGDRFGRKKIFIWGIAVFTLSSFLCGLSASIGQLIAFRTLQGIGAAMMIPGSLSIINYCFEPEKRGRAIGLWSGYAGGVAALGPFLGGWLVQTFGWPAIFYINVPLGILAFFVTLKFVPESRNEEKAKLDIWGTVFILLGLFGVSYALMSGPSLGWKNLFVFLGLVGGLCSLIFFVLVEVSSKHPLMPIKMFASRLVTGANLVTLFLYFALSGVIFFLVLNLQQVQHLTPLMAGLGMLPAILLITFLSGYGGTLADKIGPRVPMIVGPVLVGMGMTIFALSGRYANYFVWFLPGLVLFGLGMSLVIAPLTKSALHVDTKFSGAASGVNNAVSRIAGLLAIALLGAIMYGTFSQQLTSKMDNSPLNRSERAIVMRQMDKLGAIDVPVNMYDEHYMYAKVAIEDSFVYGFRWAMGICAGLAFLSAGISAVMIRKSTVT